MINDEVKGKNNNKYLDIDKTAFRGLFLSSCSLAESEVFCLDRGGGEDE